MTDGRDLSPSPPFNVRTIGPEPSGAAPIDDEDLEGLIPEWVATRADLNQVEFENITKYLPTALRQARSLGPEVVLRYRFLLDLHRQMFGDVWRWAGTVRHPETNIGTAPAMVSQATAQVLDDAKYWHDNSVFSVDERAARIHARLVHVHPFHNGNGRCTRLMADLYLASIGEPIFTWGAAVRSADEDTRQRYLADLLYGLKTDDYSRLAVFARS